MEIVLKLRSRASGFTSEQAPKLQTPYINNAKGPRGQPSICRDPNT